MSMVTKWTHVLNNMENFVLILQKSNSNAINI